MTEPDPTPAGAPAESLPPDEYPDRDHEASDMMPPPTDPATIEPDRGDAGTAYAPGQTKPQATT